MSAWALALLLLLAGCAAVPVVVVPTAVAPMPAAPRQPRATTMEQTLVIDAAPGATRYEVEESKDNGATWRVVATIAPSSCSATECAVTLTAGTGRTFYRWATITGTTRSLRTDAFVGVCLAMPECPFAPSGVGVR